MTRKFDSNEITALEGLFRRFVDSDGADGIDPTQTGNNAGHKEYRGLLKAKFLKDPILQAWVNDSNDKGLKGKIARNYNSNAKNFVAAPSAATLSNPNETNPPASPMETMSSESFHEKYDVNGWKDLLGEGSFGSVYKAAVLKKQGDGEKEYVAIKKPLDGNEGEHSNVTLLEIEIWRVLSNEGSPYILGLLDAFAVKNEDSGLREHWTVSPCMEHGTLEEYIERNGDGPLGGLPEGVSAIIAKQFLLAEAHMTEKKIVHLDIKPDNAMVVLDDDGNMDKIKIIDLGTAKIVSDDNKLETSVGSVFFQAPEISSKRVYGPECDIYSIGKSLLLCIFSYWTNDEVHRSYKAADEAGGEDISEFAWYDHWNYSEVYDSNSNPFVEEVLELVNEDPSSRPSVEKALETFGNPLELTNQQSHDFDSAADKLWKFKAQKQLDEAYTEIKELKAKLEKQDELKAKLEKQDLENARLRLLIKNIHEESGRLLVSDTDSGGGIPVAVTFDSSDD